MTPFKAARLRSCQENEALVLARLPAKRSDILLECYMLGTAQVDAALERLKAAGKIECVKRRWKIVPVDSD